MLQNWNYTFYLKKSVWLHSRLFQNIRKTWIYQAKGQKKEVASVATYR
jgi:hypothetical protein